VLASLDKHGRLEAMLDEGRAGASEGWILGVGHEAEMARMAQEQTTMTVLPCRKGLIGPLSPMRWRV